MLQVHMMVGKEQEVVLQKQAGTVEPDATTPRDAALNQVGGIVASIANAARRARRRAVTAQSGLGAVAAPHLGSHRDGKRLGMVRASLCSVLWHLQRFLLFFSFLT